MNYSAACEPISPPGPLVEPRLGGAAPAPCTPLPPGQAPPGPVPAPARPARPRAAVSLPPAWSQLGLPPSPPARSAHGPAARAAPLQGGGETASGRPTSSQPGRDPEAPKGPRLQPRLELRPPSAPTARTPPGRLLRARQGHRATPGRRRRVPRAPAWASAEGPDRESRAGSWRPPAQGRVRPGGARAPQTRIGSNPSEAAPWSSGRCSAGLRSPPP